MPHVCLTRSAATCLGRADLAYNPRYAAPSCPFDLAHGTAPPTIVEGAAHSPEPGMHPLSDEGLPCVNDSRGHSLIGRPCRTRTNVFHSSKLSALSSLATRTMIRVCVLTRHSSRLLVRTRRPLVAPISFATFVFKTTRVVNFAGKLYCLKLIHTC